MCPNTTYRRVVVHCHIQMGYHSHLRPRFGLLRALHAATLHDTAKRRLDHIQHSASRLASPTTKVRKVSSALESATVSEPLLAMIAPQAPSVTTSPPPSISKARRRRRRQGLNPNPNPNYSIHPNSNLEELTQRALSVVTPSDGHRVAAAACEGACLVQDVLGGGGLLGRAAKAEDKRLAHHA